MNMCKNKTKKSHAIHEIVETFHTEPQVEKTGEFLSQIDLSSGNNECWHQILVSPSRKCGKYFTEKLEISWWH